LYGVGGSVWIEYYPPLKEDDKLRYITEVQRKVNTKKWYRNLRRELQRGHRIPSVLPEEFDEGNVIFYDSCGIYECIARNRNNLACTVK